MIEKKIEEEIEQISCIWSSITFKNQTEALQILKAKSI